MAPIVPRTKAFTVTADDLLVELPTDAAISAAFDPMQYTHPPASLRNYKAIWDTGATRTTITQKVVTECALSPISKTYVQTAERLHLTDVFLISIGLPNGVGIPQLLVNLGNLGSRYDVLIGMDIISQGDFAISNLNGKSVFSFRMPSIRHIDFLKEDPGIEIGRNSPCPCGSGKKYKYCCGKNIV